MRQPTTLLADDHLIFVQGLEKLLQGQCTLVGTVADGRAALEADERLRPEIIVADVSMPILNGIEMARQLRRRRSRARTIILSMHADREVAMEAIRAGARGYVLKTASETELLTAINEVLSGRLYVSSELVKDEWFSFEQAFREPDKEVGTLTAREREVLQLVAEGRSLKEISAALSVSIRTAVFHKTNIMDKLGLHTTAELTQYAIRNRVIIL